ncbi:MAG: biotin/lipoyl-binding protein [Chloroflexi bacterium]|nr:biotin/lipoyl-binding protein [Chloroflexota bacterium]
MRKRWWVWIAMMLAVVLVGCATATEEEAASLAEEELESDVQQVASIVSATGEVIPAEYTVLSFTLSGEVVELLVDVGDEVEAGDILAQLDDQNQQVALQEAEAALAQAEARLALVSAGPTDESIEAAEQAVAAAQARIGAAAARRDSLYTAITDADIQDAETQLFESQIFLEDLNQAMEDIIKLAEDDRFDFEPGSSHPLAAGETLAEQIKLAEEQLEVAQVQLEDLLDGPDPDLVNLFNAQIGLAAAQRDAAQARLDLLQAQPFEEDIQVSEAEVEQAQVVVEAAEARLALTTMTAPFSGIITQVEIDANEFVGPGQVIIEMADLTTLRVETTDLSEIDVARVAVGDSVLVTFDALPSVEVDGTVVRIADRSAEGAGVNFTVVVEMDDVPTAVRWGMTAFVDIDVEN